MLGTNEITKSGMLAFPVTSSLLNASSKVVLSLIESAIDH
jgi:hypothetical protein